MAAVPLPSRKQRFAELLGSPETFATTLLVLAIDEYTNDVLDWSPQTIRLELHDDFGPMLDENADKLFAAISVLTSDDFFRRPGRFVSLVNAITGSGMSVGAFDPATSRECAWAITEAILLAPPDNPEDIFADEIRHYVGLTLAADGIVTPPDILRLAVMPAKADYGSFSTDPAMFAAEFQGQQSESAEIEEMVKANLQALISELASLPLQAGDARSLSQRAEVLSRNLHSRLTVQSDGRP